MNRITPQQVRKAYKATRLRPARHVVYDRVNNCACGIGAVMVEKFGGDEWYLIDKACAYYERDYLIGFMQGFDGANCVGNAEYNIGLEDGKKVWEATRPNWLIRIWRKLVSLA